MWSYSNSDFFKKDDIPLRFYSKLKDSLEVFQVDVFLFQSCSDGNLKVQNHFKDDKFNIAEIALHLSTDITLSEIAFIHLWY